MNHLIEYVAALNMAIACGADVRFKPEPGEVLVPVVGQIIIVEEQKRLAISWRVEGEPFDQRGLVPMSTQFRTEYHDIPDDLRDAGWR
jgi:hypothetical protein